MFSEIRKIWILIWCKIQLRIQPFSIIKSDLKQGTFWNIFWWLLGVSEASFQDGWVDLSLRSPKHLDISAKVRQWVIQRQKSRSVESTFSMDLPLPYPRVASKWRFDASTFLPLDHSLADFGRNIKVFWTSQTQVYPSILKICPRNA